MLRRWKVAALAAAAALVGGCGTVANVAWDGPKTRTTAVYGGVQRDVQAIRTCFEDTRDTQYPPDAVDAVAAGSLATLAVIDLPLSLLGDTLTLPITIPMSLRHPKGPASAPAAAPAQPAAGPG